jgi:hypothetical protein
MSDADDREPSFSRVRRERGVYPEVMTYQTTRTQRARLRHARDTRAINMSKFIRDAVERALDELEGKAKAGTSPSEPRRPAVRTFAAGGSR